MGDRAVIQFMETPADETPVNLYMHWGGHSRYEALAGALEKARPRWTDPSYATRICISQIIGTGWNEETGFGISAGDLNYVSPDYDDIPCVVWSTRQVYINKTNSVEVIDFEKFIELCDFSELHSWVSVR